MTLISSLSFQEDYILWTEASVRDNTIHLEKAVSESLPLSINYQTVGQAVSAKQVANHLRALVQKYELQPADVRFGIPPQFTIIKKIKVDDSVPVQNYREIAQFEMEKSWNIPSREFRIYLPDYSRKSGPYSEILVVAIRNSVLRFFEDVAQAAQFRLSSLTPYCFTIDEFFRTLYPNMEGEVLLLGWQRKGFDITICDKDNFIDYFYRSYNAGMQSIDQIEEEELFSGFDVIWEEIQQPPVLDKPLHRISSVYLYGYYFKPDWLEAIASRVNVPVKLLNPDESAHYRIESRNSEFSATRIYRIIESISNIF